MITGIKFDAYYSYQRYRYINRLLTEYPAFRTNNSELIPKTACFFSKDLDFYIDNSDGVNEDLEIQEYCGRILKCISISKGKKFLFFKASKSSSWSKNIEKLAEQNNGKVIPFFKWSFNESFYSYVLPNLSNFREEVKRRPKTIDIGFFADPTKVYGYPTPSAVDPLVSCTDISKFSLQNILGTETGSVGDLKNSSRKNVLSTLISTGLNIFSGGLPYKDYIDKSFGCSALFNPPGVGEYTSRIMDQSALGNVIIMRKNSYDQGHSWKDYIPEVDLRAETWKEDLGLILDDRLEWQQRSLEYYEKFWKPEKIFSYLENQIKINL